MNCLEAQSKIMAFIENKLPDDELREFIKHVRSCKNCYEELDIYYTLIVGMKQLDESDNISTDFKNAMDKNLEEEMNRLTKENSKFHDTGRNCSRCCRTYMAVQRCS